MSDRRRKPSKKTAKKAPPAQSAAPAADPIAPAATQPAVPVTAQTAPDPEPAAPAASPEPATQPSLPAQPYPVSTDDLNRVIGGAHPQPHTVLGPHPYDGGVTVRVLRPWAEAITVVYGGRRTVLQHEHEGVWTGVLDTADVPDYRLEVTYHGETLTTDDPYRFLPTLGQLDQHLVAEGRHEQLWNVLGAHEHDFSTSTGQVTGTSFAVWAPAANGVRVIGDFNYWDGRAHPLRLVGATGVWELFVPGVGHGAHYKYEILGADHVWRQKADPLAFATEMPPLTASVVYTSSYEWNDADWVAQRQAKQPQAEPMSTYEVHLGSWRRDLGYVQLAEQLVEYCLQLGFTHVEFLPVAEHPYGGSWGYQVTSYFAPTSRFGSPDELRHLIDALHQAGIGVIVDWVPAHFPKDAWALARFDGTPLYEHPDPQRGEQLDWGTYVFNFGRREVRNFLVANALFWCEEYHVDGLRVDAVASMLYLDYSRPEGGWSPNEFGGRENLEAVRFLQEVNATVSRRCPGVVTIAEESTSWPGVTRATHLGGLGFSFKWNMGWMHDSLAYMAQEPVHRQYHHHQMTFSMMYAYSESFVLPLSHDEVVHGKGSLLRKMPGDRWQQLANVRSYLAFMWAHPGKQLVFMGMELGQESEWAESRELDWWLLEHGEHRGVQQLVSDLNRIYKGSPAMWKLDTDPGGFEWIDANDATDNVFSFVRRDGDGSTLACISNFAGVPHENYRVGLPEAGVWQETLNTDATLYGGSGVGNLGSVTATDEPMHGMSASATLVLPPLGTLWLSSPAPLTTGAAVSSA